jgi:hypothetical protein
MSHFVDLSGQTFHRLLVLESRGEYNRGKQKDTLWRCRCSCGKSALVSGNALKTGHTRSCGCLLWEWRRKKKGIQKPGQCARAIYSSYRYGARKRGLEFILTFDDVIALLQQNCFYCDAKPSNKQVSVAGEVLLYSGIDRVQNSVGYTPSNCVACCDWCNTAKMDYSSGDFIERCRRVAQHKGF